MGRWLKWIGLALFAYLAVCIIARVLWVTGVF
jgi:hypothetical protein